MHPEARAFVAGVAPRAGARWVVELGARDFNGTVRDLFPSARGYTGVDLVAGPGVDVVADAAEWRPDQVPDLVVCCEVLEHTPRPEAVVRNAAAMLAPGGRLLVTAAAPPRAPHSAVDGGPLRPGEYYRNVTGDELGAWLRAAGFRCWGLEDHPDRGDVYALAQKGAR